MNNETETSPKSLAASWLSCPPTEQDEWLKEHRSQLTLSFLMLLKKEGDDTLRTDPSVMKRLAKDMLWLAKFMSNEPLAIPLACWAYGNSLIYEDPQASIAYYQRAVDGYRAAGQEEIALVPLANLLYATTETDPSAAWRLYTEQVEPWRDKISKSNYADLLRIEQNAGILLFELGRYAEALTIYQRALELAEICNLDDRVAEVVGNIALTLGSMGLFNQCEEKFLECYRLAESTENMVTAARTLMNLGELYTIRGRVNEALMRFRQARNEFAKLDNKMETGSVALREARLLQRVGAFSQARRSYRLAKEHFQALQMETQVWQATLQEAVVNRLYGLHSVAADLLGQAQEIWQAHQQPAWQSAWILEMAALRLAQGQFETTEQLLEKWVEATPATLVTPALQAQHSLLGGELHERLWLHTADAQHQQRSEKFYQSVLRYADQHGELQMQRMALAGSGRLLRQSSPSKARRLLLDAASCDDLIRTGLTLQELKASFLYQSSDVLETLLSWSIEENEAESALRSGWRAKGSALIELFQQGSTTTGDEALEQELDDIRNQLAVLRWHAAIAAHQHEIQQMPAEEASEIARLEQRLTELRRQRLQRHPEDASISTSELTACLAQMDADVLIEFLSVDNWIIAIVAEPSGNCQMYRVAEKEEILDLLDELTLTFQSVLTLPHMSQGKPSVLAECRQLLETAYELLIAPLALPPDSYRVLIAPCSPLHRLPFAAIWNGSHYWVEEYAIEVIPTGALLAVPAPTAPQGAPVVISSTANETLPANRRQAEDIKTRFPDALCLLDEPLSIEVLNNRPCAPKFLHISAHTLRRDDTPLFTSLQLAGTTLSVEQCYDLSLMGTELVVLSSCTTASGMESAGTLLAFQSAFFAAGVKHVISTLWEIQHEMAREWTAIFYQNLTTEISPADALRQTQLTLLRDEKHQHPVYWAAFSCSRR